jgi:hypothetical protein
MTYSWPIEITYSWPIEMTYSWPIEMTYRDDLGILFYFWACVIVFNSARVISETHTPENHYD